MKFVPASLIDNNLALVQEKAWRLFGAKPFSEPAKPFVVSNYIGVMKPK